MIKKYAESRIIVTSRLLPTNNARIIQSSQMPKDFFSKQETSRQISKGRSSLTNRKHEDKQIFEQFKEMFKIRRNLHTLALKLSPKQEQLTKCFEFEQQKQNIVKFPSLYTHSKNGKSFKLKVKAFESRMV